MINLGGGLFFRPHWKVMDYISPFYSYSQRYIEIDYNLFTQTPFPFADDCVTFFYSAHTFEHIPQEYCQNALNEIYRTLKPGGAVRINVPDYDQMRQAVAENNESYFRQQIDRGFSLEVAVLEQIATERLVSEDLNEVQEAYHRMGPNDFADYYTSRASREVQMEKGGYHINWFNYEKFAGMLQAAGFTYITCSQPQASRFPELRGEGGILTIGDVFGIKRWLGLDTTHPDKSLYVEAVK